jgi:hypothetical protein
MRTGNFPVSRTVGGKAYWLEHEVNSWMLTRTPDIFKTVEQSEDDKPVRP